MKKVLAFDFGASSGRAVLACICEGKLKIKEIHRFKNEPVTVNGRMYWDILRLFHEIKNGITAALQNGGFDAGVMLERLSAYMRERRLHASDDLFTQQLVSYVDDGGNAIHYARMIVTIGAEPPA